MLSKILLSKIMLTQNTLFGTLYASVSSQLKFCPCSSTNIEGLEGVNGSWDLPILALGKWDLLHWDWDLATGKKEA